jgi:Mg-chelatase subunit ChlD
MITAYRIFGIGCGVGLLWLSAPPHTSWSAPKLALQSAGRVQMVQHEPGESRPLFRMEINIVDARGLSASVPLQKEVAKLKQAIEVQSLEDNSAVHPFYVHTPQAVGEPVAIGREVLLVFDISGSMTKRLADGRTRFDAAKEAANRFLHNFQDGSDSIAIVPFESHRVVERIQASRFVGMQAEAKRQIDELPVPRPAYNTALYSVTVAALEVLQGRKAANPSHQFLLIVLTDGKNDVQPRRGDDPGLLTGEHGLQAVQRKASEVGIPIYTVGFGTPGADFDENTLRAIAWPNSANFFTAVNAIQLENALQQVRQALVDRLRITFHTNNADWTTLTERTFMVRFRLPDGQQLQSDKIRWWCTTMTGCPPEGTLTQAEYRDWLDSAKPVERTFVAVVLRRLGILALFAGGLAALWFMPPRVLWPRSGQPRAAGSGGMRGGRARVPPRPGESAPTTRTQAPEPNGQSPPPRRRFDKTL